jgi:hypothetical protein
VVSHRLLRAQESLAKHAESIPEQRAYPEFVLTSIGNLISEICTLNILFLLVLVVTNGVQALFDARLVQTSILLRRSTIFVLSYLSHYGGKLMTQHEKEKGILLKGEDRARTVRLQEEISGRLEELYLITARILGQKTQNLSRIVFTWAPQGSAEGPGLWKATARDANGNCVSVYEDPPGVCRLCGPGD